MYVYTDVKVNIILLLAMQDIGDANSNSEITFKEKKCSPCNVQVFLASSCLK